MGRIPRNTEFTGNLKLGGYWLKLGPNWEDKPGFQVQDYNPWSQSLVWSEQAWQKSEKLRKS